MSTIVLATAIAASAAASSGPAAQCAATGSAPAWVGYAMTLSAIVMIAGIAVLCFSDTWKGEDRGYVVAMAGGLFTVLFCLIGAAYECL